MMNKAILEIESLLAGTLKHDVVLFMGDKRYMLFYMIDRILNTQYSINRTDFANWLADILGVKYRTAYQYICKGSRIHYEEYELYDYVLNNMNDPETALSICEELEAEEERRRIMAQAKRRRQRKKYKAITRKKYHQQQKAQKRKIKKQMQTQQIMNSGIKLPNTTGVYILKCYDEDNHICGVKVGSARNIAARVQQIQSRYEYLKRSDMNIAYVVPADYYETFERYGAYDVENSLHKHYEMRGYKQSGNDYFKCTKYDKTALDNDIPFQIMTMLYASDTIFHAIRTMNDQQQQTIFKIMAEAEQTGKFSF